MSIYTRPSTAQNLQNALTAGKLTLTGATIHPSVFSDGNPRELAARQIQSDFDFYMESGVFAGTLDFRYHQLSPETVEIYVGYQSPYCAESIDIHCQVAAGVTAEDVKELLYYVDSMEDEINEGMDKGR